MTLKENRIIVTNKDPSPVRKMMSATFSNISDLLKLFLIDIKERMQLDIKRIVVPAVISSIMVSSESFRILREVSTTKQRPKRLEDALRICGDFCSFMVARLIYLKVANC
jgi:hypothetical protein